MKRFLGWLVKFLVVQAALAIALPGTMAYLFVRSKFKPETHPEMYLRPAKLELGAADETAPGYAVQYARFRSPWGTGQQQPGDDALQGILAFEGGNAVMVRTSTGPATVAIPGFEKAKDSSMLKGMFGSELFGSTLGFYVAVLDASPDQAKLIMGPTAGMGLLVRLVLKQGAMLPSTDHVWLIDLPTAKGFAISVPEKKVVDLRLYDPKDRETEFIMVGGTTPPTEDDVRRLAASIEILADDAKLP